MEDFASLAIKLGKTPVLLPFKPNGKAQHIKGFLKRFAATAADTAKFLTMVADLGIPMVGVDPALVLCYRDEYNEILADKRGEFQVLTAHEWLLPRLKSFLSPPKIASLGICLPIARRKPSCQMRKKSGVLSLATLALCCRRFRGLLRYGGNLWP